VLVVELVVLVGAPVVEVVDELVVLVGAPVVEVVDEVVVDEPVVLVGAPVVEVVDEVVVDVGYPPCPWPFTWQGTILQPQRQLQPPPRPWWL
jgi:hypothetical protein